MEDEHDKTNVHKDQINEWFFEMSEHQIAFQEPLFDSDHVHFIYEACERLLPKFTDATRADTITTRVFIMSVEVCEKYARHPFQSTDNNRTKQQQKDPILVVLTVIFMCYKWVGGHEAGLLKTKDVCNALYHFTHEPYTGADIVDVECHIMVVIGGRLPFTTAIDDVEVVCVKYACDVIDIDTSPLLALCQSVLIAVRVKQRLLYAELEEFYRRNDELWSVFELLMHSRYYVPCCVLLAALHVTRYRGILDLDAFTDRVSRDVRIHSDHLNFFMLKIIDTIQK